MDASHAPTTLRCSVVTPERAVLDEEVDFVALPMYDGELGILPGRLPLIGRLGFGELRYTKNGVVHRYFVDGGFVQMRANVVTVLTSRAIRAEDIKVEAAHEVLRKSHEIAATLQAQDAQMKAQLRARAQLRIAQHVGHGAGAQHVGASH